MRRVSLTNQQLFRYLHVIVRFFIGKKLNERYLLPLTDKYKTFYRLPYLFLNSRITIGIIRTYNSVLIYKQIQQMIFLLQFLMKLLTRRQYLSTTPYLYTRVPIEVAYLLFQKSYKLLLQQKIRIFQLKVLNYFFLDYVYPFVNFRLNFDKLIHGFDIVWSQLIVQFFLQHFTVTIQRRKVFIYLSKAIYHALYSKFQYPSLGMYLLRVIYHLLSALAFRSERITVEFYQRQHSLVEMTLHTFLFTTSERFRATCKHTFVTIAQTMQRAQLFPLQIHLLNTGRLYFQFI